MKKYLENVGIAMVDFLRNAVAIIQDLISILEAIVGNPGVAKLEDNSEYQKMKQYDSAAPPDPDDQKLQAPTGDDMIKEDPRYHNWN